MQTKEELQIELQQLQKEINERIAKQNQIVGKLELLEEQAKATPTA